MQRFLLNRLLQVIPVLFGITVVAFLAMHVVPGDVAQLIGGEKATEADLARIRQQFGLNDPLYVQYGRFLADAVRGDFGQSLRTHRPAAGEVFTAFPVTFELSLLSLVIATLVGVWAGVVSATHRGGWLDTLVMVTALGGISMPVFWTGTLLMLLGGGLLGLFPIGGLLSQGVSVQTVTGLHLLDSLLTGNGAAALDLLRHLALPAIALATLPTAIIARITRSGMLDVLRQDYITTARAKGLGGAVVVYRHALRNALIPVVTVIGLQFGTLLSGAILTETVFSLPGLGRLAVSAILYRDFPMVQAIVVLTAVVFVMINIVVDLAYGLLDPRIRYE